MLVELVHHSKEDMNINIKIKIPLLAGESSLSFSENLLLTPLYITERELLARYLTKYTEDQFDSAREIIFYNSLRADEMVGNKLDNLSTKEQFSFKRKLTLCLSVIEFGNKFNTDYIKSLSRSKSLAEFSVSTSSTNDPQFVLNIIKEAKDCVSNIEDIINRAGEGLIRTFVKGALNANAVDSDRLWHHYNLDVPSNIPYASKKKEFNGRYYKNGGKF